MGDAKLDISLLTSFFMGLSVLTKAPAIALPVYLTLIGAVTMRPWKHGWRWLIPWADLRSALGGGLFRILAGSLGRRGATDSPAYPLCRDCRRQPAQLAELFSRPARPPVIPGPLFYPFATDVSDEPGGVSGDPGLLFVHSRKPIRVQTLPGAYRLHLLLHAAHESGRQEIRPLSAAGLMVFSLLGGAGLWWLAARARHIWVRARF